MREIIYKTFAKLFQYPDEKLMDLIETGAVIEFFNMLNVSGNNVDMEKFLERYSDKQKLLEELQVEYTRLFINAFPTLPAPMYKSFYEDGELMGNSIGKLIDTYEKYGYKVSGNQNELPDNLALLLEFIYRLEHDGYTVKKQKEFAEEFILSWSNNLEKKILKNAVLDFYKILIVTLNKFLMEDVNKSKEKSERV